MTNKTKKKSTYEVNMAMRFTKTFKVKASSVKEANEKAFVRFILTVQKKWFKIYTDKS